ncbi:hypothetical protein NPIL_218811, partial [Nephila pilipes]
LANQSVAVVTDARLEGSDSECYLWLGIVKAAEPSMEPSLQNLSGVVWKFGESGLVNLELKEISFYERLARFHGKKRKR